MKNTSKNKNKNKDKDKDKNKYKNKNKHKNITKYNVTRKNINISKKYKLNISEGGAAFIKGGYGCIFRPAIGCVGQKPKLNYISKLLKNEHAKREYDYITKINSRLNKLPTEVKKYLLLDNIELCEPSKFERDDLKNIESTCGDILTHVIDPSTKRHITSDNINSNLDKFKLINMPELGISLHDLLESTKMTPSILIEFNNIIIEYILNVVPYLSKHGVVHGDIKASNILFSKDNIKIPVLIDWGLSYVANIDKKSIPEDFYKLKIQWQHPFSTFLFSRDTVTQYVSFLNNLKREKIKITRDSLRMFVIAMFSNFKKTNNRVYNILKHIFANTYEGDLLKYVKDNTPSTGTTMSEEIFSNYFINYVLDVLMAYTTNIGSGNVVDAGDNVLEMNKYFNDVYLYNVDIWGLMSIFYQYLLSPSTKFNMSNNEYKTFTGKIMAILVENIFTNGNKIIDNDKLVNSIRSVNSYLKSIGERGSKLGLSYIKDKLKSSGINGNILFFKSVEDSIRLRKTQLNNRDVRDIRGIRRSVKFGGRYTARVRDTRRKRS
jgi:serine/threonine protein kinase